MGIVKTGASGQEIAGQNLAEKLSSNDTIAVKFRAYDNYTNLLIDMKQGTLQMAWLPPVTYTLAHEQAYANVALLTNHFGVYLFGSQFFAHVDTGLSSYFDEVNNKNTADAKTALSQLNGKRPCYVDLQSTSGYVIPQGYLYANGFRTQPAVLTQSHSAVIRALYIKGICDFGATFATTGDPRTASTVLSDLTDVKEKIFILWQTPEIIPTLNLSFQPTVSPDLRNKITQLLLKLVPTDEGKSLLSDANDYEITSLQPVDDVVYNEFRAYLQASEADPIPLMGK